MPRNHRAPKELTPESLVAFLRSSAVMTNRDRRIRARRVRVEDPANAIERRQRKAEREKQKFLAARARKKTVRAARIIRMDAAEAAKKVAAEARSEKKKRARAEARSLPEYLELRRMTRREKEERNRKIVNEFKASGCSVCGESDLDCLDAHHSDPKTKRFAIAAASSAPAGRLREELERCVCLCANCHRKAHAARRRLTQS
jgi:hypothetical protein